MTLTRKISLCTLILSSLAVNAAPSPEIESVLNKHDSIDYGSSVSADGKTMYYTHTEAGFKQDKLMVATLQNGKVVSSTPLLLGGKSFAGSDIQLSPDGKTLTFCSDVSIGRSEKRTDHDLFYATKTANGWSAPKRYPDSINTDSSEFYPVLTRSGNLYFSRANENTSLDLYVAKFVDEKYQQAEKLGPQINTELLESDAYIAPDEAFMVFVRMNEEGAHGVSDLYLSLKQNSSWSKPVNLGSPFNFAGVDGSPFVTQDKKWLYFTSNRDAPEPSKFDAYLGAFRIPFQSRFNEISLDIPTPKIYSDVKHAQPFYEQGQVIFNTSMPNDGSSHLFRDNRGFDRGPTGIYQRQNDASAELLILENAKIPADVHISPDGNSLYFVDYGDNPSRIYQSQKQNSEWQTPAVDNRFPAGSGYLTSTNQGVFYFHKDGDIHRFNSTSSTALPKAVNSSEGEFDPFIAQDESFLIVVRQDAEGDSNMYLSVNTEKGWTEAEKLPEPFNANKVDGSPYVTPDKRYLFWSSNRDGDVLKTWQVPIFEYLQSKLGV